MSPAFAVYLDKPIEVPHLGTAIVDVSLDGGDLFVLSLADRRNRLFGLRLDTRRGRDIVRISEMIKVAAQEQLPVVHPEQHRLCRSDDCPAFRPPSRPTRT